VSWKSDRNGSLKCGERSGAKTVLLLVRDAADIEEQDGDAGGELGTGDGEGDGDDIRRCCSCCDARLAAAATAAAVSAGTGAIGEWRKQ
jgi:hypothetical protein